MAKSKEMSMEEFFQDTFSEEFLREAEVEYTLAQIAGRAFDAKKESKLSFRDIAKRMGVKTPAVAQRIVNEAEPHNVTLSTLVRFGQACGFDLDIEFRPKDMFTNWATGWTISQKFVSTHEQKLDYQKIAGTSQQESRLEDERTYDSFFCLPGGIADKQAVNNELIEQLLN